MSFSVFYRDVDEIVRQSQCSDNANDRLVQFAPYVIIVLESNLAVCYFVVFSYYRSFVNKSVDPEPQPSCSYHESR